MKEGMNENLKHTYEKKTEKNQKDRLIKKLESCGNG